MGEGRYTNDHLGHHHAHDGTNTHSRRLPPVGQASIGHPHRRSSPVHHHAFGGFQSFVAVQSGASLCALQHSNGDWHHSGGMLSRWCVKQHHVVPLQGRCGLFSRYDLCLHFVGSSAYSPVGALACRGTCRCGCLGNVQANPHRDHHPHCMPGLSVTSLACIVGGVITAVHDPLVENGIILFLLTFCMVFCHNTIGYFLGYSVGKMCQFSVAKKRTLSIEVGMQNAGLGTNLAMTFFVASNPMAVVPCAISCAWHSISGTILANIFASRDKKK